MVKKIAALAGAGALLLGMAGPAFAHGWWWWHGGSRDVAIVENGAVAYSDTGGNTQDAMAQKGGDVDADGSRYISTGNAGAVAVARVRANTHIGCGPCAWGGPHHKDFARVRNGAEADALTGYNHQDAMAQKGGDVDADGKRAIHTGNAWSKARAFVVVNTHWGGGWIPDGIR